MTRSTPGRPICPGLQRGQHNGDTLRLRTTADPQRYTVNLHLDNAGDAVRHACPLAILGLRCIWVDGTSFDWGQAKPA